MQLSFRVYMVTVAIFSTDIVEELMNGNSMSVGTTPRRGATRKNIASRSRRWTRWIVRRRPCLGGRW